MVTKRTIKSTTLDPCTSLSESDSKQYTNFEFCEKEEEDLKHFKNTFIYKASNRVDPKNQEHNLHILEDSASGDIEQVIVKKILKIW